MKRFYLKTKAILDIILAKKFYLVTFKDNNDVDWRTEYNIDPDEIHDKI